VFFFFFFQKIIVLGMLKNALTVENVRCA